MIEQATCQRDSKSVNHLFIYLLKVAHDDAEQAWVTPREPNSAVYVQFVLQWNVPFDDKTYNCFKAMCHVLKGCWDHRAAKEINHLLRDNLHYNKKQTKPLNFSKHIPPIYHMTGSATRIEAKKWICWRNSVSILWVREISIQRQKILYLLMVLVDKAFKVKLLETSLLVRRVKLNPGALLGHEDVFNECQSSHHVYQCKVLVVPRGM